MSFLTVYYTIFVNPEGSSPLGLVMGKPNNQYVILKLWLFHMATSGGCTISYSVFLNPEGSSPLGLVMGKQNIHVLGSVVF